MKYIIDTKKKEIYIPDGITLINLLSITSVLNSDTEDYNVFFYDNIEDLYEKENDNELYEEIFNYIFEKPTTT